jgi:hypothetical protein
MWASLMRNQVEETFPGTAKFFCWNQQLLMFYLSKRNISAIFNNGLGTGR